MNRIIMLILILILLLTPGMVIAETSEESDIKQNLSSYFDLKYKMLSELTFEVGLKEFIDPGMLNSSEVINEADILETVINLRKIQINDLRFERYSYKLVFKSIKIDADTANVTLNEESELYYKCAPTVKNSSLIEHILILKNINGKWLILNDTYNDLDGIKKKLNKYFIESGISKEEAMNKVLNEAKSQSDIRLLKLETILDAYKDNNTFVFYLGKNAVYLNGISGKIENERNIIPIKINGIIYLPLKFISEKLGYSVTWEEESKTVKIINKEHNIILNTTGEKIIVDNKSIGLENSSKIINGRLMLPASTIAETFNQKLFFDNRGLIILGENLFDYKKNVAIVNKLIDFFNVLFTKEEFPKIDGSTATYPFSIELSKTLLGLDDTNAKGFITHKTTHNAYVNLLSKNADIIFVTEPSSEEIQLAKNSGIELEVIPFCNEGFVFLANKENKINNLTEKQVKDIYQGKIKNWKEVGGENNVIIPYQREANSGSQTLMENIVMKGLPLINPPKETIIYGMGELIDRVADYSNAKNALGYSVYYYATTMYKSRNVKLLSINGVDPDKQTIKSGKYPFTTGYYAVIRKSEPKESNTRKLLKWVLGPEGQEIVDKAGFVAIKN